MLWIFILALLQCGLNLYRGHKCMSWRVMAEKRLKESTHTSLVRELFRLPVHQIYTHTICFTPRCVCVRAWAQMYMCSCVCDCEMKHHLLPIRDASYSQTCFLTMNKQVWKKLRLDKNHLYHHSNLFPCGQAWHPPDLPLRRLQKYALLNLPH